LLHFIAAKPSPKNIERKNGRRSHVSKSKSSCLTDFA
jgi:hypothetical protein